MPQIASFLQMIADKSEFSTLKNLLNTNPKKWPVYPDSLCQYEGSILFLVKKGTEKRLMVAGDKSGIFSELEGVVTAQGAMAVKECLLTVGNSKIIRKYFAFTNPTSLAGYNITIGLGDRLGLATPGHIRLFKDSELRPVLAQQSTRELFLTGRSFAEVLADVTWGVFQEGYRDGYGADGDHLKNAAEVKSALDNGYTMITLDCSEHIHNLGSESDAEIERLYRAIDAAKRRQLETDFLGSGRVLKSGLSISFTEPMLYRFTVIYQEAIDFAIKIFDEQIKTAPHQVDYEISIDETMTPTEPSAHYFVGCQLMKAGVKVNSMAPRFCGEFQKGIDYIGDLGRFEREFKEHLQIAEHFGYKLSIHSGSDKFSVFPVIGRESKGRFHLKTAGTNWLEAVRVIIKADPRLYRELHLFALEHLAEARKYYHVGADISKIPDVNGLPDRELPELMNQNDARQLIHITYGLILQARDENGRYLFRDRIYRCLNENEELFYQGLQEHIGKHLKLLGVMPPSSPAK